MSRAKLAVCLVACHFCSAPLLADVWTSSESLVSVARPDASRFEEVRLDPPIVSAWVAKEGGISLAIVQMPFPRGMKLIQNSLAEGFRKEFNGKISRSDSEMLSGYTVCKMKVQGKLQGQDVFATQSVVAVEDKLYKLMATSLGSDALDSQDVQQFFGSLKILRQNQPEIRPQSNTGSTKDNRDTENPSPMDQFTQKVGGASLLLLLIGLLVLFLKRRRTSETSRQDAMRDSEDRTQNL